MDKEIKYRITVYYAYIRGDLIPVKEWTAKVYHFFGGTILTRTREGDNYEQLMRELGELK